MFAAIIQSFKGLSKFERALWIVSLVTVTVSYICPDDKDYLSLAASLIGVTAIIFVSKGNVLGQILFVVFGVFYGIISYSFRYYGEMMTYLGMTAPMAVLAVISWIKNPYCKNEVRVNHLKKTEVFAAFAASAVVTVVFHFILKLLGTANLFFSTLSISTSFLAAYFTFRRSRFYALFYVLNDVIIIILWTLATIEDRSYLTMIMCFAVFFANDLYGFVNWSRMKNRQEERLNEGE